jgi:hypothetical protein
MKKLLILSFAILLWACPAPAQVCGSTGTTVITPSPYVPDSSASLPAIGGTYTGELGCNSVRVYGGTSNSFGQHEYSQMTPFSNNDTYLLVLANDPGGWKVLNRSTGATVCTLDTISQLAELRWAIPGAPPGDAEGILYYHVNQTIRKYDVSTCTSAQYDDLSTPLAGSAMTFCGGQSDISFDGDHLCVASGSSPLGNVYRYTISTKTLSTAISCNGDTKCSLANMNNASILPVSNDIIVDSVQTGLKSMELFDGTTGLFVKRVWWRSHYETAKDAAGDEVLILFNVNEGDSCNVACTEFPASPGTCPYESALKVRVSDRTLTCLLPGSNDAAGQPARVDGHLTSNNEGGQHFRAVVTMENEPQSNQPSTGNWLLHTNELVIVDLDGTNVKRLIHHLSRRVANYWSQPRAALSRSGRYLAYDSNFGQGTGDSDWSVYVIDLQQGSGGATYYVDFATGADTNNGTAKGTPWKHANGMQGCASTCASTVPAAGDSVIFKGGVTWDSTCWSWVLPSSGDVGNPIYYGVDLTWFAGGSFTQPVFDAAGTTPTAISMLRILSVSNLTFDNFEMKNLLFTTANGGAFFHLDTAGNILMERLYLHGWDVTTANDDAHGAVYVSPAVPGSPNIVDHTTISNTEFSATHNNGVAITAADVVSFSTIHDVPSFCLGCGTVHDSVIYGISYPVHDFDGAYHTNGHYMIGAGAADYNNLYYNFEANAAPIYPNIGSGGAGACQDWTQYIYNNVVILAGQAVPIAIDVNPEISTGAGFCGSAYVMNNTIQSDSDISAIRSAEWTNGDGNVFVKNLTVRNNHVINSTGANTFCFTTGGGCGAPQTLADTNSVFQTNANAASQGYTSGNQYRPSGPGGITVAAGLNLFSLGISTLDSDKLGVPRPSAAAWDDGAYEYFGASGLRRGATGKPGTKIH